MDGKCNKRCGLRRKPGKRNCRDRNNGYVCTLQKGHYGKHIACGCSGNCDLKSWPKKKEVNHESNG